MANQIPLDDSAMVDGMDHGDGAREIAADIAFRRMVMANVVFFGERSGGDGNWVLIDTGIAGSKGSIIETAERRFGSGARPAAIVLTHGHFDHVGALEELVAEWDVPVYAHLLEHPYLEGSHSYPPADPWVGGGLMAVLSPLFPRKPVDIGERLRALPEDGSIPGMAGWRWLHTAGHAPGHVSLWREADRSIIAGDAFITTGQESAYDVAVQRAEMHGPPRYFTPDWGAAHASVEKLARLEPELVVTGHGRAARGATMRDALHALARDFREIAVPKDGKYVRRPLTAEDGSVHHGG